MVFRSFRVVFMGVGVSVFFRLLALTVQIWKGKWCFFGLENQGAGLMRGTGGERRLLKA